MCRSKGMAVRGPVSERGPALLGRMSDSEPFDGTRATGVATDENTNERAPNQKNVRQNRPLTGGNHQNQHLSGKNRFIPDEILIEGQKIKTTGALLTGGRSAAVPRERIAQHLSERALTADGIYDTLSLNQKNVRQNRTVAGQTDRHIRKRVRPVFTSRTLRRTAATYSPTWSGSTIGDDGLSFSVRNGKRRFPVAIATAVYNLRENQRKKSSRLIFPERKISGY